MIGSARVVAIDTLSFVRCMSAVSSQVVVAAALPRQWQRVYNGEMKVQSSWVQTHVEAHNPHSAADAFSDLSLAHSELSDDAIEEDD